jgi:hypothetical protein
MRDRKQLVNQIFNLLDRIEDKTNTMAHEIPSIAPYLRQWQDKQVTDLAFYNFICKEWDKVNQ